jgi:hypothetical protein
MVGGVPRTSAASASVKNFFYSNLASDRLKTRYITMELEMPKKGSEATEATTFFKLRRISQIKFYLSVKSSVV